MFILIDKLSITDEDERKKAALNEIIKLLKNIQLNTEENQIKSIVEDVMAIFAEGTLFLDYDIEELSRNISENVKSVGSLIMKLKIKLKEVKKVFDEHACYEQLFYQSLTNYLTLT